MGTQSNAYSFLRRALRANGVFSTISGITFIIAGGAISTALELPREVSLAEMGVSLLIFAAGLFWIAYREAINQTATWIVIILDAGWVAGSAALILSGVLSAAGNLMVALVAAIVLLFAALQFHGLRKARQQTSGQSEVRAV